MMQHAANLGHSLARLAGHSTDGSAQIADALAYREALIRHAMQ
jgi:hypothetical protein